MQSSRWPDELKATVMAPDELTCYQGNGSTIDYLLVSDALVEAIAFIVVDWEVSWGPHALLVVGLHRYFEVCSVNVPVQPKKAAP